MLTICFPSAFAFIKLAIGYNETKFWVRIEGPQNVGNILWRAKQPEKDLAAPLIAVVPVRRFLGVNFTDEIIVVERAGIQQRDKGHDISAMIGHDFDACARKLRDDFATEVGRALLAHDRNIEVEGGGDLPYLVRDLLP